MNNSRSLAAQIIYQVLIKHHSLDIALKKTATNTKDQGFIYELCYGTIRWYYPLTAITQQLLHKPLPQKHQDVQCLLLIGLYQLIYMGTPAYAAISATVDAVKTLKKSWAVGLVNKLLRLFTQQTFTPQTTLENQYSHPDWLIHNIQRDWPEHWQTILNANNAPAPLVIRINPQKTDVTTYLSLLHKVQIKAITIADLPYAIQLTHPVKVTELPHFTDGFCYIQDQAGQYTAGLLQLKPGLTILDACAAPGSKTTDILQSEPQLQALVALDKDSQRLHKVKENIARLQLPQTNVQLIAADATQPQSWWHGDLFDRILIDAPCSATGVLRRHPDIKILRQANDIDKQAQQQLKLLNILWPLLKKGGLLLYATCSILKKENTQNIQLFLQQHPDANIVDITIPISLPQPFGNQILPTVNGADGFYYALLTKNSNR